MPRLVAKLTRPNSKIITPQSNTVAIQTNLFCVVQ